MLEYRVDPSPVGRQTQKIVTEQQDPTLGNLPESRYQAQQSGLSATRRPQKSK